MERGDRMTFNQIPKAQGLYRPDFEHDACGIGLYAHIKGVKTHAIVEKGLEMLTKLDHRGGKGRDSSTGDGAGVMVEIPDLFFRKVCQKITLPERTHYGVGMLFIENKPKVRQEIEERINHFIKAEGQVVLGWRDVPVNVKEIGEKARKSCPIILQVFVGRGDGLPDGDHLAFERKLYLIRKQVEIWAKNSSRVLYFSSLSSRTIVYKGLLTSEQVPAFYLDLQDPDFISSFALVHSRFSTNTFPSWERAHPNRYLLHNGEINTLRGNVNWMRAREERLVREAFGEDADKILPILDLNGSDSSILDNALEFFILAGMDPAHVAMTLVPEPWSNNPHINNKKRSFYEYYSMMMEPWDGPAALLFTDGDKIAATLDRNGLRPIRYYVTKDDYIILSSEVGVIEVEHENILYKERLSPGMMLLIDLQEGRIITDEELKMKMANQYPYEKWLNQELVKLFEYESHEEEIEPILQFQKTFGYTYEDIHKYLLPIVTEGKDPIGSMGNDMPLAVLSERPQSFFNYFKQLFAQVTNPPIDSIREKMVTSTISYLGSEGNLLHTKKENCRRIQTDTPVLTNGQMNHLKRNKIHGFKSKVISITFANDLEAAVENIGQIAEDAISKGFDLIILSDKKMNESEVAMPILLAVSSIHQRLVNKGLRIKASIIAETGETREVHHFAALLGYGADAINPYLAFATYKNAVREGSLSISYQEAVKRYVKAVTDGIVKVMAKMGISTIQSYRGAQIFEAVGISEEVIERYFSGTASQIGGITLDIIEKETILRHKAAFKLTVDATLESGSDFQWRKDGEHHAFNPSTIHTLQRAVRKGDYQIFKKFSKLANEERIGFIRNLFDFEQKRQSISIDEVESIESIVKRFKTGAMSYGSLSKEAHETLAIAMNQIGGKSNSGEGGEDPERYIIDTSGDNRRSRIKQIASGRFGVKSHYLVHADELQIKMAQGAKPGEGGQLPGNKVYPWIAETRGSTPGVGLISPPPNHDIYSIEDLAQLIYDLKNANRDARISVKLVSKSGVGTIAAGVAKGNADVIVISGYDGGTGASPKTSIKHTGLPWELGLAEAHQTLMLNGLRDRVRLETDGKLMTGKDVVMAALLGAEEFSFGTAPLVSVGCVMMRACHLDTCPVGVATQNPELRAKFTGDPQYVVNFMNFVAQEVREIMAELGFRTVDEMVGRTEILQMSKRVQNHWKSHTLKLDKLLYQPKGVRSFQTPQDHQIESTLDIQTILPKVKNAMDTKTPIELEIPILNIHRAVGTIVGSDISKQYGEEGLPEDTITLNFSGSAGQSFGAFVPKGMKMLLTGDVNDYLGKGLSGGKLIVKAPSDSQFSAPENVICGNVALYGATSGEVYINGRAGERFAVRNSGVKTVVEGIGDHGCEYMTGGTVVVLGKVGKNFGAGMSGGITYILSNNFDEVKEVVNSEMVDFEVLEDPYDVYEVKKMVQNHYYYTGSLRAAKILKHWNHAQHKFLKIIPKDYKNMLLSIQEQKEEGFSEEQAIIKAFETMQQQKMASRPKESVAN